MKFDKTWLIIFAGISLFVGFVIFAVGLGAVFPAMHKWSAPLICRGEVEVETTRYSYKPGQVGWQHHIYCVYNGAKNEITFQAIGMTGLLASAVIFILLALRMPKMLALPKNFGTLATDLKPENKKKGSALERLSELKKMRDQNLISESEYERKKTEIMKDL